MKPKISILGSGDIGGTLARLLVHAGYEVAIANSRGPASMQYLVDELGASLHPMTAPEAIAQGEIVILAVHWRNLDAMPIFDVFGKIVVDATNPYKEDGSLYDLRGDIPSTKTRQHFPDGMLVKAFNTIWFKHLAENGDATPPVEHRRVIPLCGNDAVSKSSVAALIESIGFAPLDTGNLTDGSAVQAVNGLLYNKELSQKEAAALLASA